MTVTPHDPSDVTTLRGLAAAEPGAKQRDRFRAVLLAAEGEDGREPAVREVARRVARSPRFVDRWVGRYRRGGLAALRPGRSPGRPPGVTPEQGAAFKARVLAGPAAADGGVCRLGGADARRVLADEFGVEMSLSAAYALLGRLNLSCLRPRPRRRKNDPAAAADWLARAPLLPAT